MWAGRLITNTIVGKDTISYGDAAVIIGAAGVANGGGPWVNGKFGVMAASAASGRSERERAAGISPSSGVVGDAILVGASVDAFSFGAFYASLCSRKRERPLFAGTVVAKEQLLALNSFFEQSLPPFPSPSSSHQHHLLPPEKSEKTIPFSRIRPPGRHGEGHQDGCQRRDGALEGFRAPAAAGSVGGEN